MALERMGAVCGMLALSASVAHATPTKASTQTTAVRATSAIVPHVPMRRGGGRAFTATASSALFALPLAHARPAYYVVAVATGLVLDFGRHLLRTGQIN